MTTLYILKHTQTVCFVRNIFYTEGLIKNKGGFSVGAQTGVGVWTSQCDISSTGNITTNGTITSAGYLAVTGTTGRPTVPSAMGCYLGCDNGTHAALELCGINGAYVEFTTPGVDFKGNFQYTVFIGSV